MWSFMETLQTRLVNFLLRWGMDRTDIHKMKKRIVKCLLHCVFKCMSVDVDAHLQVRRQTECQHVFSEREQSQLPVQAEEKDSVEPLSSKNTGP